MKFFGEMHKSKIFFDRRFLPSTIAVSRLRRLIPISPPQTKNTRPISPPKQKILEPPLVSRLLDYATFALGDTEVRPADTIATLESTLTAVGPITMTTGSCESTPSRL